MGTSFDTGLGGLRGGGPRLGDAEWFTGRVSDASSALLGSGHCGVDEVAFPLSLESGVFKFFLCSVRCG